jgi:hypothetical protein
MVPDRGCAVTGRVGGLNDDRVNSAFLATDFEGSLPGYSLRISEAVYEFQLGVPSNRDGGTCISGGGMRAKEYRDRKEEPEGSSAEEE